MSQEFTAVEALLRRERLVVLAGLLLITALAWWWVAIGAGTGMSTLAMTTWQFPPPVRPSMIETWTPGYALVMFLMWWIMMIAMMTPSARKIRWPKWSGRRVPRILQARRCRTRMGLLRLITQRILDARVHANWTETARGLDAECITDFGGRVGRLGLCWALGERSVAEW